MRRGLCENGSERSSSAFVVDLAGGEVKNKSGAESSMKESAAPSVVLVCSQLNLVSKLLIAASLRRA